MSTLRGANDTYVKEILQIFRHKNGTITSLFHLGKFFHHAFHIPITYKGMMNRAVSIDEHPNGYGIGLAWESAMQGFKLRLGQNASVLAPSEPREQAM